TGAIVEDLTNSYNLDQTADDDETLLDFVDTLIIEEGSEETDRAAYAAGSLFTVAITGVAEDFGLNGTLSVDDDQDGLIEHTATILNMEVIRTLSDTENDTLDLSALEEVVYDNSDGDGDLGIRDGEEFGFGQTQGFETVIGTGGDDVLLGGKQGETLSGGSGEDVVFGGSGDDSLLGGSGDDTLGDGDGDGDGDDTLDGGAGCDILSDGDGDDVLLGGAGNDFLIGFTGTGADSFDGGEGDDVFVLAADGDADTILGGSGIEYVHYTVADSDAFLEEVVDTIVGDGTGDTILTLTNFEAIGEGSGVEITFFGDGENGDEEDEDGDDENEGFVFEFLIDVKTVTETIIVGDVADATDADEVAIAVFDALDARGYDVEIDGDAVTILAGPDGELVVVNDISTTGDTDDDGDGPLAAVSNQGVGVRLDLTGADFTGVDKLNLYGASLVIDSETFDDDILIAGAAFGAIQFGAESDDGEAVTNTLNDDNLAGGNGSIEDNVIFVVGGSGNDTLTGNSDNWGEIFEGDDGDDLITGNGGIDLLNGRSGDDTLIGGDGNDLTDELATEDDTDDDVLNGGAGDDQLFGEQGNDLLRGGSGDDSLFGGDDDDELQGGSGDDSLDGGDDDDSLEGESGNDTLLGGSGNDELDGGSGNDSLVGGDGEDELDGGDGNDTLDGGDDDDVLESDVLGEGADVLTGGAGDDIFVFFGSGNDVSRPTEPGPDSITDFNGSGETDPDDEDDVIDLSALDFTGANSGTLFVSGESGPLTVETDLGDFDDGFTDEVIFAVQDGDDVQVILDLNGNGIFEQSDAVFILEDFDADDLVDGDFIL
ncbi:MAG: calcium-binding protein, partial [Pseudomonadota bacterium]